MTTQKNISQQGTSIHIIRSTMWRDLPKTTNPEGQS
jgi:hypothetical protein